MDELIDNFNEFRAWLYETYNEQKSHDNPMIHAVLSAVVAKFENLGLDKAF